MKYVTFGSTGVRVSEMCLGTMMFGERCDEAESDRILSAALDGGVTFVDTAASYSKGLTEEIVGRIIRGKRDGIFLGTKVARTTDSAWVAASIDESLKRLRVEFVDLYMIHWPRPKMDSTDMMMGLNNVVKAGKARFVGCCNFPAWLFAHCNAIAARNGWAPLVCNQIPYNLLERGVEVEVLPQAVADKVAITVYRPLSMGVLAGRYRPGEPVPEDSRGSTDARPRAWFERYGDGIGKLLAFAAERGLHPAQVAVAWVKHSPGVTCPIVGASSLGQIQATVKAFDIEFTADEYARLTAMFDTAVKEESGGNFVNLRRSFDLLA
jgi:aryl-alcohol dehydrogenase-like predicted oxidoreductase